MMLLPFQTVVAEIVINVVSSTCFCIQEKEQLPNNKPEFHKRQ